MAGPDDVLILFNAGRLEEAVAAASGRIRAAPADPTPRMLLAELLLFRGEFERADTLLSAVGTVSPEHSLVVAEFRQLLRAETSRRQVFADGALPSFIGEPTETQRQALRTLVALRAGDAEAAASAARAQEEARPRVSGHVVSDGETAACDDFRDVDDVLAGSLEVLTTTGAYYWIPTERIASLLFHPARRPRDLFWRRCSIEVESGPDGDVYVPCCYLAAPDDPLPLRLGRETDWSQTEPVRGRGQRLFLAGEAALPVNGIERIGFGSGS